MTQATAALPEAVAPSGPNPYAKPSYRYFVLAVLTLVCLLYTSPSPRDS